MKKVLSIFCFVMAFLLTGCPNLRQGQSPTYQGQPPAKSRGTVKPEDTSKMLKVGALLPLSGEGEKIGDSLMKSITMAVFNNPKNNIEVKFYDTKSNQFAAINALQEALDDGAKIIIGPVLNATTKSILPLAKERGVTVISLSNNQEYMNNPNVYLMGFTPEQEIERLVTHTMNNNAYGFSAILPNDMYGGTVNRIYRSTVGRKDGKIVKIEYYNRNDSASLDAKIRTLLNSYAIPDRVYDEYEESKKIRQIEGVKGEVEFKVTEEDKIFADVILIPETGRKLVEIASLIQKYMPDGKKVQLVGTSKWENRALYSYPALDGGLFTAPDPDKFNEFESAYRQNYGTNPYRVASLGYDAVMAIAKIAGDAKGTPDFSPAAMAEYKGFNGVDGEFRFLPNGIVERKFAIIEITNGDVKIVDLDSHPFLKY